MGTSVDDVPNEIWENCWNRVTRDDLRSLSCVCQRFRSICQSLLFKSFTISISRMVNGPMFRLSTSNLAIIQEKLEGLQGVISNPFLVNSVHRLIISTIHLETAINGVGNLYKEMESGKTPLSVFLCGALRTLPAFSKTKSLILEWPIVLSDLLDSVISIAGGLLPIEDLTLSMEDVPSQTFDEFPSLKILALGKPNNNFRSSQDPQPDSGISIPASVEYLFAENLVVAPKVLFGLSRNAKIHQNLISFELHLGRGSFPLFLECLPFCPQMKYIVIHRSSRTTCDTTLCLSETSIPQLETFIGPLELALVIAPNRPIKCLGIIEQPWKKSTDSTILHDITQLAHNTGPVEKLSFTLCIEQRAVLTNIVSLYPSLTLLNIEFHDDRLPLESGPERGVQIKDGRLESNKPWNDADSLENHPPGRSIGYKGLVYDVALGRLQLPSTLEVLRLDIYLDPHYNIDLDELARDVYFFEPFTFQKARRVVYALARRYPRLQQVHIGNKRGTWLWVKVEEWQAREECY